MALRESRQSYWEGIARQLEEGAELARKVAGAAALGGAIYASARRDFSGFLRRISGAVLRAALGG
jgi:hypothetical protein